MARFVHLTSEKNVKSVLRSGIRASAKLPHLPRGVYAMPITRNFYISHQWLRELKRAGQRSLCAVYFTIGDYEEVWVGHYTDNHKLMTAAEAIGLILHQEKAEGYEVLIPRKVLPSEVRRIRNLPQVLGWRFVPGAHGKKPCSCPICLPKGEIKSRRIREASKVS